MPTFRFQCMHCGLNFQQRAVSQNATVRCECGQMVGSTVSGVHAGVSATVTGVGPTTTGLSGVDYNADRAIAEYSAAKWKSINDRQRDKIELLHATGATGFDLTKTHDGGYRVMDKAEREASERSRQFHFNVLRKAPPPKKTDGA